MPTLLDSNTLPRGLNKSNVELYKKNISSSSSPILTNIGSYKECYNIENNILIFLDHKLVEYFNIMDGTEFEQIPTEEGILLRRRDL